MPVRGLFYYWTVLRATAEYVRDRLRKRAELIPLGYSWSFVMTIDASVVFVAAISAVQRPGSDLPLSFAAVAIAVTPMVLFFVTGTKYSPGVLWASSSAATAIFLFATSTPIPGDFAPVFQVLMVGTVGSLATLFGGLLATASAAGVLLAASVMHPVEDVALSISASSVWAG